MAKSNHKSENPPIQRQDNRIFISDLSSPTILKSFTHTLKRIIYKLGYQDVEIIVDTKGTYFPNVAVPICGIIDYYSREGIDFQVTGSSNRYSGSIALNYYDPNTNLYELERPLSKIWRFSDTQEINDIQKALIGELRKEEVFAAGVLEGIEWSINEVMDNVINHSEAGVGFIMGQLHKTSKHVAFTVYDAGIGIYNSFRGSRHDIRTNVDALSLCIQEGITRDVRYGQGNGLAGLLSLIKEGNGILNLASGLDTYSYKNAEVIILNNQNVPISRENGCTTVDFQIDYSKDVSIEKVLTFQGRPFTFTNLYLEDLEDDYGVLHFNVAEMSEGTGTRESAQRLKNQIINLTKVNNSVAEISFKGIEVVASSYIDELIAKLVIELGLFQFNQRIRLTDMSPLLQKTLQKSVIQRIVEDYS